MNASQSAESGKLMRVGALRSRLVSKLTGLTVHQLQYWHGTELLSAHERPGARGRPRLYSWVDYMKLREAAKLFRRDVPTRVIRKAVPILEELDPAWYLLPLEGFGPRNRKIIDHLTDRFTVMADAGRQILLPIDTLERTLAEIENEGPLGELHDFRDAVTMHPQVLAGNPVVLETRLETQFIAGLKEIGYEPSEISDIYHLPLHRIERALEFEQAVAA